MIEMGQRSMMSYFKLTSNERSVKLYVGKEEYCLIQNYQEEMNNV